MNEVLFESTTTVDQDEFRAFVARREPWDPSRYELLNGRIVMNPPAGYPHGSVESRLQWLLQDFVTRRRLGQVLGSSQGFELPSGDTVEPDASFVGQARWDAMPAPEPGQFLRVAPDLVVEILSTGTASRDRGEKKAIHERNDVREYWLVDARSRTITRFGLRQGRYDRGQVFASGERCVSEVLAGLDFAVDELFP